MLEEIRKRQQKQKDDESAPTDRRLNDDDQDTDPDDGNQTGREAIEMPRIDPENNKMRVPKNNVDNNEKHENSQQQKEELKK